MSNLSFSIVKVSLKKKLTLGIDFDFFGILFPSVTPVYTIYVSYVIRYRLNMT